MRRSIALLCIALLYAPLLSLTETSASTLAWPSVSGSFGQTPTITFPNTPAPVGLTVKVLHRGSGPVVKKKDLLVVNYLGQIWRGKVFGTTFSKQLVGFPIGVGDVIAGWDQGLVNQTVGSRVLLIVPPAKAYGKKGQPSAGITGSDTLVFVVDIVGAYNKSVTADPTAGVVTPGIDGVTVTGPMTKPPSVTVAKNTPEPSKDILALIRRGNGPKMKPGLIVIQTLVANWSGNRVASTWSIGTPDSEDIGQTSTSSLLNDFVGEPVGSRFLALVPKSGGSGPYALVIDVVAEPKANSAQVRKSG